MICGPTVVHKYHVLQILQEIPTAEEIGMVSSFQGKRELLGLPERYVSEVGRETSFKTFLELLILQGEFENWVDKHSSLYN